MGLIYRGEMIEDRIHEIMISRDFYDDNVSEIIIWLVDNFGYDEDNGRWDLWDPCNDNVAYFAFRYERDAMAFKLMWGK